MDLTPAKRAEAIALCDRIQASTKRLETALADLKAATDQWLKEAAERAAKREAAR